MSVKSVLQAFYRLVCSGFERSGCFLLELERQRGKWMLLIMNNDSRLTRTDGLILLLSQEQIQSFETKT